ncbi:MAG: outer membrane lipoprotein-sorting protein [Flavobacteriales bacterium]
MRKTLFTLVLFSAILTNPTWGQNVNEIIAASKTALGGDAWDKINGLKYNATVEQMGMSIPIEIAMMANGKMYVRAKFQGMEITQEAYDGETKWSTNFMTQKAEKADQESTENTKRGCKDFPNGLFHYQDFGYTPTLEGEEMTEGAMCYKIKLEKKTQLSEGKEVPNIEYYYIDKDSKAILMMETEMPSGEMKGQIAQMKYSDYQEVSGVYVAFSQTMGIKGGESQALSFSSVVANPNIPVEAFQFPGDK